MISQPLALTALESLAAGIVLVRSDGKVVLANRGAGNLLGVDPEALAGRSLSERIAPRHRMRHALLSGKPAASLNLAPGEPPLEIMGLRGDDSEVALEVFFSRCPGESDLFCILMLDAEFRRRAREERELHEQHMRHVQKLDAVGRLAAGMANEFNNALSAIVGFAELARSAETPAAAAEDLDQLLRAAMRGKDLVERVQRFTRRQEIRPQPIDLHQAVKEAARFLRAALPASIEIRVNPPADSLAPVRVFADAMALEQMLMNLGVNAGHSMPAGGLLEISVDVERLEPGYRALATGLREGMYGALIVRDTGHGMDAETLARAFEPFFTTKSAKGGSGLGLSLVQRVVRDHGGAVWIESDLARGTTVRCLLPIVDDHPAGIASAASTTARGHGERVMIVDDQADLVLIWKRHLTILGYAVMTSSDPRTALEYVRAHPAEIDLLVTDYSMPHANGVQLTQDVTRLRPGLPVILMSGYGEDIWHEGTLPPQIRETLQKPFTLHVLAQAVSRALAGSGHKPPNAHSGE